jgi:signal transduction histidine kinase
MTRSGMILIVVLMCAAIAAVVILQGNWLINSYAVSKDQNEAEIRVLLEQAINEQKHQTADTVRRLIRQMIRSEKDFNYAIMDWPTGLEIGFAGKGQNTFARFAASEKDTVQIVGNPYEFLIKKIALLKLDELNPLYVALVGVMDYANGSPEKAIQLQLSGSFKPYENAAALASIVESAFSEEGRPFNGKVRFFKDISDIYKKPVRGKSDRLKVSRTHFKSIAAFFGSDNSRSLSMKLDLLAAYTDSLNRLGDSTFVAKPLLYDVNDIMMSAVPAILLSVDTPHTLIAEKMSSGILGSFALMIFIALSVIYMYSTIVKQKQLSDLKNDFISNITHELKTPIATAQAAVQGLSFFDTAQNPEKASSYLSTASAEIQRLSLMVDKILNISLFENAAFTLSQESFNFKSLLMGITDSQKLRKEKPIVITLDYDAKTDIFGDKTQLANVMINLIDNAIKYSGAEVNIDIRCKNTADGIEVAVSDNGNGIPPAYRDFIFDKFFRVPDVDGHRVKGYGLGLNYVKTIVEKHQGSIVLAHSGAHGSIFIIKLPQPK